MTLQLKSQNILYPPVPPTLDDERTLTTVSSQDTISTINTTQTERETFVPGKFDYIESISTREMLQNAWQAINQTEMWSFIAQPIERFMMSNNEKIYIISNKIAELGYDGHSGVSFGWTMRQMQIIAKHGEIKFREQYLKKH